MGERRAEEQAPVTGQLRSADQPVGDAIGVPAERADEVAVATLEAGHHRTEGGGDLGVVEAQDVLHHA